LTGDSFVRDAQGRFSFVARSDDMIISSGYNIAGPEVEAALLKHASVAECGVVGAPDEARGQIVKAYVVLRPGCTADDRLTTELQDHVKREIAPYKYPRAIEYVAELPKTQTGKLQRFALRRMAVAGSGSSGMAAE
jgi:2-aminobenzoate-CoA ligase